MKKLLPLLLFIVLLAGCSTKKTYYTLGSNINIDSSVHFEKAIDIVTVEVPKYLEDPALVRQITPYQIKLLDHAQWLTPMKKRLTNVLIDYLQKAMNNPQIHLYPWDANKKPYKRVSVTIKRFIAYKDKIYLDANYKIYNFETKKTLTKLFTTTITSQENIDSMMESMEKAYLEMAEKIKSEIIDS